MNTMNLDSLTETLRTYPILPQAQLDEVTNTLAAQFPDPQGLLRELFRRGWLTSFQAKQLLAGKGAQLVFGQYLVLQPLGGGGMGQVFKCRHLVMGRIVALKVLRKELVADDAAIGRFYREVEVISQLDHPSLVHAYDADVLNSIYFLALEYIEGLDLEKMVSEGGALPIVQACDYMRQAALGLQYAHEKGLVHRDIKPANLLVAPPKSGDSRITATARAALSRMGDTPWGIVKILDMGLARISQPPAESKTRNLTTLAGSQVMLGTPDYMAPEQAIDFHRADIRADIYSLGCTFYFLLTGKPPFAGGSAPMKLIRHQQADPPPLEQARPEVPAELAAVVMKMLAKKLPDRPQTPAEVAEAISTLMETPNLLPPAPAPHVPVRKEDASTRPPSSSSICLPGSKTGIKDAGAPARRSSANIKVPPRAPATEETNATVDESKPATDPETKLEEKKKAPATKEAAPAGKRKAPKRKAGWKPRRWKELAGAAGGVVVIGVAVVLLTGGGTDDSASKVTKATTPATVSAQRTQPAVAYLCEMPDHDAVIGYGQLGRHGRLGYPKSDGPITVNGKHSKHGLSTHPGANTSAKVWYHLGKQFQTFRTSVALNDDMASSPAPLTFKVFGDGKLLWESKPITKRGEVYDCDVSVKGVDRLALEVFCDGVHSNAHAVWVEPQLER
jgi:serine/threonine-protein kinase